MAKYRYLIVVSTLALLASLFGCGEDEVRPFACFLADTRIATPDGVTSIQNLRPGDAIVSVDPRSGEPSTGYVREVHLATVDEYLVVTTKGGRHVRVTPHHPFWSPTKSEYTEIGQLARGKSLLSWSRGKLEEEAILELRTVLGSMTVYHLKVDRAPHTFVANDYVVHNKTPYCPSARIVSVPSRGGQVLVDGLHLLGQGGDTLYCDAPGTIIELVALPETNWTFSHWEGSVVSADSIEHTQVADSTWVRCYFDTLN